MREVAGGERLDRHRRGLPALAEPGARSRRPPAGSRAVRRRAARSAPSITRAGPVAPAAASARGLDAGLRRPAGVQRLRRRAVAEVLEQAGGEAADDRRAPARAVRASSPCSRAAAAAAPNAPQTPVGWKPRAYSAVGDGDATRSATSQPSSVGVEQLGAAARRSPRRPRARRARRRCWRGRCRPRACRRSRARGSGCRSRARRARRARASPSPSSDASGAPPWAAATRASRARRRRCRRPRARSRRRRAGAARAARAARAGSRRRELDGEGGEPLGCRVGCVSSSPGAMLSRRAETGSSSRARTRARKLRRRRLRRGCGGRRRAWRASSCATASCAVARHRPLDDRADGEDRRLRRVDHGGELGDAEHAEVRDREGAVRQLRRRDRAVAHALGERGASRARSRRGPCGRRRAASARRARPRAATATPTLTRAYSSKAPSL